MPTPGVPSELRPRLPQSGLHVVPQNPGSERDRCHPAYCPLPSRAFDQHSSLSGPVTINNTLISAKKQLQKILHCPLSTKRLTCQVPKKPRTRLTLYLLPVLLTPSHTLNLFSLEAGLPFPPPASDPYNPAILATHSLGSILGSLGPLDLTLLSSVPFLLAHPSFSPLPAWFGLDPFQMPLAEFSLTIYNKILLKYTVEEF